MSANDKWCKCNIALWTPLAGWSTMGSKPYPTFANPNLMVRGVQVQSRVLVRNCAKVASVGARGKISVAQNYVFVEGHAVTE